MTDVIHKVLNDITVDDRAVIIGGDSHTRMSKGVAFGADSGTVALALATGEATMPIPESVKVTFKGTLKDHMDFRDVVHATQAQMLEEFGGENVFQGRIIEVHIGTLLRPGLHLHRLDRRDEGQGLHLHLRGRDPDRVAGDRQGPHPDHDRPGHGQRQEGPAGPHRQGRQAHRRDPLRREPPLTPDDNAKYFAEFVVDLDQIDEPMIADPDVHNDDVSKRYTHDTIRPISYYG